MRISRAAKITTGQAKAEEGRKPNRASLNPRPLFNIPLIKYIGSRFGAWADIRASTSASSAAIRKSRAAFNGRRMFGSSELLSKVISFMQ